MTRLAAAVERLLTGAPLTWSSASYSRPVPPTARPGRVTSSPSGGSPRGRQAGRITARRLP